MLLVSWVQMIRLQILELNFLVMISTYFNLCELAIEIIKILNQSTVRAFKTEKSIVYVLYIKCIQNAMNLNIFFNELFIVVNTHELL